MHDADLTRRWRVVAQARGRAVPRVPFRLGGRLVGSVAAADRAALRALDAALLAPDGSVAMPLAGGAERLARLNAALRERGAVRAWRDETYPVCDPASGQVLATMERAAARFWGTLTFGAHATGWVAARGGGVAALWIAQRAFDKPTDPGAFDNLIGGGVPHGQTPAETLQREGWEEAGLARAVMARARPVGVFHVERDVAEGLQVEALHAFELELAEHERPANRDGEVHAHVRLPVPEALALAAEGAMTVDAALVTLEFALRHRLLDAAEHAALAPQLAALRRG